MEVKRGLVFFVFGTILLLSISLISAGWFDWLFGKDVQLSPGNVTEKKLIAHYSFEGNASDVSMNENDGIIVRGVEFIDGIYGESAAVFGEPGQYISISKVDDDIDPYHGTISAWAYPTEVGVNRYVVQGAGENNRYYIQWHNGEFRVVRGSSKIILLKEAPLNKWYHIVLTWDYDGTQTMKGYLNGEFVGSEVFVGADKGKKFKIGTQGGGKEFLGSIGDVQIYNYALSEEEISYLSLSPGFNSTADNSLIGCFESDGLNYQRKGTLITSVSPTTRFEDYCEDNSILKERRCLSNDPTSFVTVQYDCSSEGKVCQDGACVTSEVNETCTDSDGGKNYLEKGSTFGNEWATFDLINKTDYCVSSGEKVGRLAEYYCWDNQVASVTEDCSELYGFGYYCEDGACVKSETNETCTDSDGGLDYYVKGTITGADNLQGDSWSDVCYGSTLYEGSCRTDGSNEYHQDIYDCPNGCQDGACVETPRCGILQENEMTTIVLGEYSYDVSINFIGSGSVKLNINGEVTNTLEAGESYVLSDGNIVKIREINTQDYVGGVKSVSFCFSLKEVQGCFGCELDFEPGCVPYGTRIGDRYCSFETGGGVGGQLILQKESGDFCENGYECLSDVCVGGLCAETAEVQVGAFRNFICRIVSILPGIDYYECIGVEEPIPECYTNEDCADVYGDFYCSSNIYVSLQDVKRNNCVGGKCVLGNEEKLYTDCQYGCRNGACLYLRTCNDTDGSTIFGAIDYGKIQKGFNKTIADLDVSLNGIEAKASGGWEVDLVIGGVYAAASFPGDGFEYRKTINGKDYRITLREITEDSLVVGINTGLNYNKKGEVTSPSNPPSADSERFDRCVSENYLYERYCDFSGSLITIPNVYCPNGCVDGACVSN